MILAAKDRALGNGFNDNKVSNTVFVYSPPIEGAYSDCTSTEFDCNQYVQVIIHNNRDTFFAKLVGIPQTKNIVRAVSAADFGFSGPLYGGASIVGLADDCKTIWLSGNNLLKIWGGSIFSNSSKDCGVTIAGSSNTTLYDGSIDMVANGYTINGNPPMDIEGGINGGNTAYPYPPPDYMLPKAKCTNSASVSGNTMTAGFWSAENKSSFPPKGVTTLQPGTYCVYTDFTLNAKDVLTGTGVSIIMEKGGISWNGGAEIKLTAPASGDLEGLLIFAPMSNSNSMTFNGNGSSLLRGLIFTPAADIAYNGTSAVNKSYVQIIAYTVELTGKNDTLIVYQDPDNWDANQPPVVGITE